LVQRRLIFDATPFLFRGAGVGRVTASLYEHLCAAESAYEVSLYVRCMKGFPEGYSHTGRKCHLRLPQFLEAVMKKWGVIERVLPGDLYHATDHYLPLKDPSRCVATVHDMMFLTHPDSAIHTHARQARLVPSFLEKCRRIIAVSEATKRDILATTQVSEDRIDVVHWAVDQTVFYPETDVEVLEHTRKALNVPSRYLLAVGCSTGRKNTPRLLEAFRELLRAFPHQHLVLVWDPPPAFRETYAEIGENLTFTGKVTDAQLRCLYTGALVSVYVSRYEGFGLPVLEAMACGTPVITGDNTSLPEVGGEAARYVDVEDTESIVQALSEAVDGRLPVEHMRSEGRKQVQTFTWKQTVEKVLETYDRCF